MRRFTPFLLAFAVSMHAAIAEERTYLAPADFIASVFPQNEPAPKVLWLTNELRREAARILGHEPQQLRQKYWSDGQRTLWILDEVGKEDPITAGFVVKDDRIDQARVLIYRESRGSEIRLPAFLAQFRGAGLAPDGTLSTPIDSISGATLSVNAMVRMSRLALLYDRAALSK